MNAMKIILTALGAALAAAALVLVAAMVTTMLAVGTGTSSAVPGLVRATAGTGAELVTTQIEPGAWLWFGAAMLVVFASSLCVQFRRARRRELGERSSL